jgi:molybdopterin-guanine dinucleotide biosynthesis protein A
MGRDKARADSAGRALALRVADQVSAVCGTVSLVGDPSIYAELGLPVIADRFPGQGPLAGIEAALSATSRDANLIVACDMPAIRENLLEELFSAGGDCATPRHANGDLEPLCAVYRKRCHPAVLAALKSGVRSVTEALLSFEASQFELRYVQVSDPEAFANLNTPEDWRRYHHG